MNQEPAKALVIVRRIVFSVLAARASVSWEAPAGARRGRLMLAALAERPCRRVPTPCVSSSMVGWVEQNEMATATPTMISQRLNS
jgi:hypothetical protein